MVEAGVLISVMVVRALADAGDREGVAGMADAEASSSGGAGVGVGNGFDSSSDSVLAIVGEAGAAYAVLPIAIVRTICMETTRCSLYSSRITKALIAERMLYSRI